MTLTLTASQIAERCTVTVVVASTSSLPSAIIVVDSKAYTGIWTPGTAYTFTYDLTLERGPHTIYGQATDSAGTVTTASITYVMAYELTEYGIDIYSGDAKLDVIEPLLHDALLPDLPTLNFSCATLLTGNIGVVIRERGLRQYQFTVKTVGLSNGLYTYTCLAAESYALTTAIMALQTAYGATSDAIRLLVPSLNIVNADVPTHSTVNFVTNGGFETGITSWHGLYGSVVSYEVGAPLVGIGSLKMVSAGGGSWAYFSMFTAVVGHVYQLEGRVKSTAAAGRKVFASNLSSSGTAVDCSSVTTVSLTFTAVYTFMEVEFSFDSYAAGESFLLDSVVCYDLTPETNVNLLAQTTYPQLFANITPTEIIKQFMIQALAQASVRNGNLYVFPLDVSAQMPDYHMQRLDPLTGWQKDADVYDAVVAHYTVKQFPTPSTVLTLNDHLNWTGTVSDVTEVADTLLPVPSGALGMLKSVGNASRAVSTLFKYFDRIQFNWLPVTAAYVDISLQQDVNNKLDLRHTWAGQSGSGFVQTGSPGVSTDTVTEDISCDDTGSGGTATKFVTTATGTTTANCSYRVTLLDAASAVIWQDVWSYTIGSDNTFSAHVPTTVSRVYQAATVRIEFTNLYLIGTDYGVQCTTCDITIQTWINIDSHQQVDSSTQYVKEISPSSGDVYVDSDKAYWIGSIPTLTGNQVCNAIVITGRADGGYITTYPSPHYYIWRVPYSANTVPTSNIVVNIVVSETVQDWLWSPSTFIWSDAFNLFESVDLPLSGFTRTGNPANLATIALTFTGDNYVDSLVLVADNPLPVTVRAGTGSRAYVVTDDFGSEAGAQTYADGLLPIVSVAREQYTRDVSLATDLGVGDTVNGDGVNMTVYAVDYRPEGKTIAAGKAMDTLMTRLAEQSRQIDTLKRQA